MLVITEMVGRSIFDFFEDISERKRAEKALRESERKLDWLLQTIPDGMVMVDLSGQIMYANPGAERILGLSKDLITGRLYNGREWRQIDEYGEPFPADRLPLAVALREQREAKSIEHGIVTPDGESRWLSVNAAPLFDEAGRLYGAVAGFRDITQDKRADVALRNSEAKFASVFRSSPDAIAVIRAGDDVLLDINEAFTRLLEYAPSEVLGKTWQELGLIPTATVLCGVRDAFAEVIGAGRPRSGAYQKSGSHERAPQHCRRLEYVR